MFFQGLHMSATEGNLKALVAQSLPLNMRGTGFSLFAMSAGSAVMVSARVRVLPAAEPVPM